jgi:hypothetical protein
MSTCSHSKSIIIKGCEYCQYCGLFLAQQSILTEIHLWNAREMVVNSYQQKVMIDVARRIWARYSQDADKDLPTFRDNPPFTAYAGPTISTA